MEKLLRNSHTDYEEREARIACVEIESSIADMRNIIQEVEDSE